MAVNYSCCYYLIGSLCELNFKFQLICFREVATNFCIICFAAQKLIDAWYGKGPPKIRSEGVAVPKFCRETGERIVAYLLFNQYLKEDFHFTPYSTICYIQKGKHFCSLVCNRI